MRRGLGLMAIALVCAGCSGEEQKSGAKTLTLLTPADLETLDPGAAATSLSAGVLGLVHRSLYAFFPGDERPDPDLASGPPEVARDGRTVTVRLRRGVRFGAQVDRDVRAADVKYGIERAFTKSVANGLAPALYGDLEGVAAFQAGRAKEISGIRASGTVLEFRLRRGTGGVFADALTTLITAPVPEDVARRSDGAVPSTYGARAVPTGPYRIARYERGRRLVLERNPAWSKKTDARPAHADRIEIRIGGAPDVSARQVVAGKGRVTAVAAPAVVRDLARARSPQLARIRGVVVLLALNTTRPGLGSLSARRAIAAAIDREPVLSALGGASGGHAATHFLPPGMPGFEQAGGLRGPAIEPAGGGVAIERELSFLASNDPSVAGAATLIAQDLRRAGFRVRLRTLDEEVLYSRFCTVPARRIDLCLVGFVPAPHQPQSILGVLFDGRAIQPEGNFNLSQLDDPAINAALDAAARTIDPHERAAAYGAVDRRIVATASAVPLAWLDAPLLRSADVRGEPGPEGWNLAFLDRR